MTGQVTTRRHPGRLIALMAAAILVAAFIGLQAWAAMLTGVDYSWYINDPHAKTFYIDDAQDLRGLSNLTNPGEDVVDENGYLIDEEGKHVLDYAGHPISVPIAFEGVTIEQRNDISLVAPLAALETFAPIGTEGCPFEGIYDGLGHSIQGFNVTQIDNAGLFGVVGSGGSLRNIVVASSAAVSSQVFISAAGGDVVRNVGTLVGLCNGSIENCSSVASLTVRSDAKATVANPITVENVGGLVGFAKGDMTACAYKGDTVRVTVTTGAANDDLIVGQAIGGLVGRFGSYGAENHGTMRECVNTANVWAISTGAGEEDRFGVVTFARIAGVGGVAGSAAGSIIDCQNGAYDALANRGSAHISTSATDKVAGAPLEGKGGSGVGGIVGMARALSSDSAGAYAGEADEPMVIENCRNFGNVTGCVSVGGLVGQGGAYVTVTQSANGVASKEDIATVTSTRWNKPATAGVVGSSKGTDVSFCANFALVQNILTGYYTSGIVGSLTNSADAPEHRAEVWACFNSGHIYTDHRDDDGTEYREAGLVGYNEGYVHDCVMLYGTVPYHDNAPIGANDWGMTANLHVMRQAEMQSSYCAALLNASNDTWNVYWYMPFGDAAVYPTLSSWGLPENRIMLTEDLIAEVTVTEDAKYLGPDGVPVPKLKVVLTDGTELWQNTDFYVIPEDGACEIDNTAPYQASICGLGRYDGRVDNVVNYSIGKGDLSIASVLVANGKYALGAPVFPSEVTMMVGSYRIAPDSYSYVIYDYGTESIGNGKASYPVFDSEGYVSYQDPETGEYSELIAVSEVHLPVADDVTEEIYNDQNGPFARAYRLYDRNRTLLSDSDANVYDASGMPVSGRYSCAFYRTGSPAGYIITVSAKDSAPEFMGTAVGRYNVSAASMMGDVKIDSIMMGDEEWFLNADEGIFYTKETDEEGNEIHVPASTVFTGEQLRPAFELSYLGHRLEDEEDFRCIYGDPMGTSSTDNVSVTTASEDERAGVTLRPADDKRFSNYLTAYFDITPANFEDCEISIPFKEYAFTGQYIEPEVTVMLDGVQLVRDRDYKLAYYNNVRTDENEYEGAPQYVVTPLDNLLQDPEAKPWIEEFSITKGIDISAFDLELSDAPIYYNFGEDPLVFLTLLDEAGETATVTNSKGEEESLTEGVHYETSFEVTSVGETTMTVSGIGPCTGTIEKKVTVRPLDVTVDPYSQIEVSTQELAYGTWAPEYGSTDGRYNIGDKCPVRAVVMKPVVGWHVETDDETGEETTVYEYGQPYTSKSAQTIIGEVGATYAQSQGSVTYQNAAAGDLRATVSFKTYSRQEPGSPVLGPLPTRIYGCTGTITLTIPYGAPADIATDVTWQLSGTPVYDGTPKKPVVGVANGSGKTLREGVDYTIEYLNNVDSGIAGYAVAAVEGGNYTGSYSSTFGISPADLTAGSSIGSIPTTRFDGNPVCPEPTVVKDGVTLVKDVDYTLAYQNNDKPGTGTVYVSGKGNYTGRIDKDFTIARISDVDISDYTIRVLGGTLSGSAFNPGVNVITPAGTILSTAAYTVEFYKDEACTMPVSSITSAGTYYARAVGNSDAGYCGVTAPGAFTVNAAPSSGGGSAPSAPVTPPAPSVPADPAPGTPTTPDQPENPGDAVQPENPDEEEIGDGDNPLAPSPIRFVDVEDDAWYTEAVYAMAARNLITGYTGFAQPTFGVGDAMTRAQFATILWRHMNPDEYAAYDEAAQAATKNTTGLSDVAEATYYTAAANWALASGVMTGIGQADGSYLFAPDTPLTFEQMVTMVCRIAAADQASSGSVSELAGFRDGGGVSEFARPSMAWAVRVGLVEGYAAQDGSRTLEPVSKVARERVATVMYRALDLKVL